MEKHGQQPTLKRGLKKFTASTVADRMSYWMRKSPQELFDAQDDESISALDQICIGSLLSDIKYGRMKNMDIMLSRIVGTPVNQTILQNKVSMSNPVQITLQGVEAGDENSLQALNDLKATDDNDGEVRDSQAPFRISSPEKTRVGDLWWSWFRKVLERSSISRTFSDARKA